MIPIVEHSIPFARITSINHVRIYSMPKYVAAHGTARVPRSFRTADGFRLGGWFHKQRSVYQTGKLSPERISRLEASEGWVWKTR